VVWQDVGLMIRPAHVHRVPQLAFVLGGLLVLCGLILCTGTALASTIGDAADNLNDGVFVASGSGQDADALRGVVAEHADEERVVIAVFAGGLPPTPEDRANDLLRVVAADTVLLFTPDDVAVASTLHTTEEVDAAFDRAGPAALDGDAAVASRALLDALGHRSTPIWVWVGIAAVLVGLVVLIAQLLERRREREGAQRSFDAEQAQLRSRLQTLADRILQTEAHVTIADDPALAATLTEATGIYQDVLWSLERVNTLERLLTLHQPLEQAEALMDRIADRIG
jgi:hypothetical protein